MTIFIDAATITTKTTPSAIQIAAFWESTTIISLTTVDSIDDYYVDASTFTTITSLSSSDDLYLHPTGSWGPFDNDGGAL